MHLIVSKLLDEHTDGVFSETARQNGYASAVALYRSVAQQVSADPDLLSEQPKIIARFGIAAHLEKERNGAVRLVIGG